MSKVLSTLILIFLYFIGFLSIYADGQEINIISRAEWGAIEEYRYLDSPEWEQIIQKWKDSPKKELTEYEIKRAKIEANKVTKANNYLINNHSDIFWINKVVSFEDDHKLAWPLAYSKQKVSIVVHHTDSDIWVWWDNYDAIRKIYKYHALTRAWWDIGYNYLIWTNWEIFEWRAGWDFVIWAHDKWNNQSSIWISLIWNYDLKEASTTQIESLEKLIKYLEKKYSIDFNKKQYFFKWCNWTSTACIENPLIIEKQFPLIWHKDAWHTACPWEKLYAQLQEIKKKFHVWENIITISEKELLKKIEPSIKKLWEYESLEILSKIELALDENIKNRSLFLAVKNLIWKIETKADITESLKNKSFDDNNKIKVKLSYPYSDKISFNISKKLSLKFEKTDNEFLINFLDIWNLNKKDTVLDFELIWKKLFIKDKQLIDFEETQFLRIKVPEDEIIEISSWNRKPSWDSSWKLNDNEFRWDIVLYYKNDRLVVVNDIILSDYLKWLWEVSNSTNPEKIKVIIILARSYARWYMTKARKFAWEWFDASDNPNIFQKYLWFGLEKRSEKVNKIVEETKDLIVTFDWELIKPWYFSSSDWKTTSFIEYCENAKWVPDCSHPERFPFLVWVTDNGWEWKEKAWHWVWVPWTWVQYFSERWWNFNMIIKYFLKWIEIEKKS